jgi:TolA-binding protein
VYALHGKIQLALRRKQYTLLDAEAADFQRLFPQSPLASDVRRLRGRSLLERKQYAEAVLVLEPLVAAAAKPDQGYEDRYLLALGYEGVKRYRDALPLLAPLLAAAPAPLKSDAQLTQAAVLVALKRYGEAVSPLEAVLAANPQADAAVRARAYLAVCYARTGQLDRAKTVFAELPKDDPPRELVSATIEQLSEAAYEAGDPTWAAQLFGRMAANDGSREQQLKGLSGQAWSDFKAGRLAEAEQLFAQLLQQAPPAMLAAEAALARGQILEQLHRADAALAMYDQVIDRYGKAEQYPQALLAAARLRNRLGQHRQAAAQFERLAREFPRRAELDAVLYQWAWALADAGSQEESLQVLQRIYHEQRESHFWPDVAYRLAERANDAKDFPRAEALAGEILAAKTDAKIREHTLYLRGQIAIAQHAWPRAQQAFEALVHEFPQSSTRRVADYWIAEALYRQGDYAAAGEHFDRLAQETEKLHESWTAMIPLRRAQVLAQRKQWTEAQAICAKIENDYPAFQQQYEVDYVIGRCLAAQADFDAARQAYQKVIRAPAGAKTETAAMAQWMIGESYFHQKNYDAALRAYLQVEILYAFPTWQAGALLQAGKCHELLGEWKEAVELYQRLLTVYPNTPFTEEAQRRVKAARLRVPGGSGLRRISEMTVCVLHHPGRLP